MVMTWIVNINLTQRSGGRCRMFPLTPARCLLRAVSLLLGAFPIAGACSRGPLVPPVLPLPGCAFDSPGARDPQVVDKLAAPAVKPCPRLTQKAADR